MQSVWINGARCHQVDVSDRGLAYGDGLFETLKVYGSRVLYQQAHFDRMEEGASRLGFNPAAVAQLKQELSAIALPSDAVLKFMLTRGAGGRGYSYAGIEEATRIIILAPLPDFGDRARVGVTARFCHYQLGLNPTLAGIKHLNRLEQVLARNEWQDPAIAEGIVTDCEGFLAEGTMSNLFWVEKGRLFTPLLDRCGVRGIIRNRLLALASANGIPVEEGRYRPQVLEYADEVFLCNSLIDIWPITSLDGWVYKPGPLTTQLQQLLYTEYQA